MAIISERFISGQKDVLQKRTVELLTYPFEPKQDHLGYQEGEGTNENLAGIAKRALFIRKQHGAIGSFAGIGHPAKLLVQAAMLQPTEQLQLVDISAQNVFDGTLLINALQAGYPTILSYIASPIGEKAYQMLKAHVTNTITKREQQAKNIRSLGEEIDTSMVHLSNVDNVLRNLIEIMKDEGTGINIESVMRAVQQVKKTTVIWGSIRYQEIVDAVTESIDNKPTVVDFSNVPVYNIHHTQPIIFSSLMKDPIVPEKSDEPHIFMYPTDSEYPHANILWYLQTGFMRDEKLIETLHGGLTVVCSPNPNSYYNGLIRYVRGSTNIPGW